MPSSPRLPGMKQTRRHDARLKDDTSALRRAYIRKIARRAGVKRLSPQIYNEVRSHIKSFVDNVLMDAIIVMESKGKSAKTLKPDDIVYALKRNGRTIYA